MLEFILPTKIVFQFAFSLTINSTSDFTHSPTPTKTVPTKIQQKYNRVSSLPLFDIQIRSTPPRRKH